MFPFLFHRPKLPKECWCGNTDAATCAELGLRNHRNFPPFAYIPEESDLDKEYYGKRPGALSWSPIRHWAIAGDIVEVTFFIRPRALIETLYGERVLVNFHLESDSKPTFFHWDDLKPRSSLLVLYPVNRTFMDLKHGIRQENAGTVMVFPVNMETLNHESSALVRAHQSTQKHCFFCEKEADSGVTLKRCTGCHVALYCDRAQCQLPHWKASHRKLCHHTPKLKSLATLDFSHFDNFFDWSVDVTPPPSVDEQNAAMQRSTRELVYHRLTFSKVAH